MPPSATILNAGGGISVVLDFIPLNKQTKRFNMNIFEIHVLLRLKMKVKSYHRNKFTAKITLLSFLNFRSIIQFGQPLCQLPMINSRA